MSLKMQPDSLCLTKCFLSFFFFFFFFHSPGCQCIHAYFSLLLPVPCQVSAAVTTQGPETWRDILLNTNPSRTLPFKRPPLTRLTCCQCSDDYNLPTFFFFFFFFKLFCAQGAGDSLMTSCKPGCAPTHRNTCAHEHTHFHTFFLLHEISAQTPRPRLQLSPFTALTIVG